MVKCRVVSRVQETQSLLGMAVSGGKGEGVMDSKEVAVEGGGEYCLLAAAACIHGKQIWFFSDFSDWRSQLFSSHPVTSPPILALDKGIKQNQMFRCALILLSYLTWPLPYKCGLGMSYQLFNLIKAGIFVMLSDDSRFH